MVVGVCVFELQLPQARSLKQKRKVIRSLIDRIHGRFRVSISETDLHDLHQRSEIAIAAIARSDSDGRRLFDSIRGLIDLEPDAVLLHWEPQLLEEM
jgi:hypothetical protein